MVASSDPNRNRKSVGGQDCSSCLEPLFKHFVLKVSSPGPPRPNTWQSRLINAAADDSVVADLRVDLIGSLGVDGGDGLLNHGDGFVLGGALSCECCAGNKHDQSR